MLFRSFVIAHRLSTIVDADLILVMEAGTIIEQGTHEEMCIRDRPQRLLRPGQPLAFTQGVRDVRSRHGCDGGAGTAGVPVVRTGRVRRTVRQVGTPSGYGCRCRGPLNLGTGTDLKTQAPRRPSFLAQASLRRIQLCGRPSHEDGFRRAPPPRSGFGPIPFLRSGSYNRK